MTGTSGCKHLAPWSGHGKRNLMYSMDQHIRGGSRERLAPYIFRMWLFLLAATICSSTLNKAAGVPVHPSEVPILKSLQNYWQRTFEEWDGVGDCSSWPVWDTESTLQCNDEGRIIQLGLRGRDLTGNIPASIGALTNLQLLDLAINKLTGNIPASIGDLINLRTLVLYYSGLSGSIPDVIGALTNLQQLSLSSNRFTGRIPPSIGNLTALSDMDLAANDLNGTIPASIGALINLQLLDLSVNSLTGSIPDSFGGLTILQYINVMGNQLTGTLPASLIALTRLDQLVIGDQSFSCPANGGYCPLKRVGYEKLYFCRTLCADFCRTCFTTMPPPPLRLPPPKNPPPRRSPPPRNPPPRSLRPPPPPVRRSPPPTKSPPPPRVTRSPPPTKLPPPVAKRPPPPKNSPPVTPGAAFSFGFAPALSFTPRFLNGQVFRHASVNYSYDSRRNWRIDSSTDWTTTNNALGHAISPPIKEQGPCAACWAMASVSAVSAVAAIVFSTLDFGFVPDLSVQQVISCSSTRGCDGGLPSAAFNYIANFSRAGQPAGGGLRGLFTENNYKYTTTNATCQLPTCRTCKPTQYGITMYEQADFYGWFGLLLTLQQQPAVVTLYAACTAFLTYKVGILDSSEAAACDSVPNHAVLAVGYVLNAGVPYWILQNSWGTRWGEGGRSRIAITGGFGLCNMHLMPALYPVITTSSPCSDPINPCGSGTCVPNGDSSSRCECRDPFVAVTNIDNRTQSCVPKAICNFFLFNPCSVGTCMDDGVGGYSCVCPLGFVDGERSTDSAKTCVPTNTIGSQKYTVSVAGLTCSVIAGSFGLTVDQLLQQNTNPPLICDDGGIAIGTVLDVSQNGQEACNVLYTWNENDNCVTVAQRFSLPGGYADVEALNPWLRCAMSPPTQPGMQVCVRRGDAATSFPNCTNYYTAQKGDTCDTIATKFQMDAFAFYSLNPGIYCSRLQLGDMDIMASGQQVCVSADTVSFRQCPAGSMPRSVVRGDTCLGLLARFFGSLQQMAALNYGFQCAPRQLFVGKIICIPASGGGRPPPPITKKAP